MRVKRRAEFEFDPIPPAIGGHASSSMIHTPKDNLRRKKRNPIGFGLPEDHVQDTKRHIRK